MINFIKLVKLDKGVIGHNEQDNIGMSFTTIASDTPQGTQSGVLLKVVSSTQAVFDNWVAGDSRRVHITQAEADAFGKALQPAQAITDINGDTIQIPLFDITKHL